MNILVVAMPLWLALFGFATASARPDETPVVEVTGWAVKFRDERFNQAYEFAVRIRNAADRRIDVIGVNLFFSDRRGRRILGFPLRRTLHLKSGDEMVVDIEHPYSEYDLDARRIETLDNWEVEVSVDLYEVLFSDGTSLRQ